MYRIGGGTDGRSVQSVTRQVALPRIQQNAVTSVFEVSRVLLPLHIKLCGCYCIGKAFCFQGRTLMCFCQWSVCSYSGWVPGVFIATISYFDVVVCRIKSKALPLQAWTGPEVSRRLRLPYLKTIGI